MAQRIIDRSYVGETLQHIYNGDLDVNISFVFDKGYFYLSIGDKRIILHGTSIEEAVTDMAVRLAHDYPLSSFANWWINNFREEKFSQ